jgi:RNA polymerase sigma factor (sigma-70 family)
MWEHVHCFLRIDFAERVELWLDSSVFEKAKKGDSTSIELLVKKYYRLAYSAAYVWVRKGVISKEDGLSEARFALMKCIRRSFDSSKGDFAPYLVTAVDNQIRMYLRKERREKMIEYADRYIETEDREIDIMDSLTDDGYTIEEVVEQKMLVNMIMQILEENPCIKEKEAKCLTLRMNGLTYDEIAAELGMSQSYASRLSNNAIEKVKQILRESGGL